MTTIQSQTGWIRSHPQQICQDRSILIEITDLSFDINDKGFVKYATGRGVMFKAGTGPRLRMTGDFSATKKDYIEMFRYGETGYRFTDEDMDVDWEIMQCARGALQDCWELYQQTLEA